MSVGFGKYHRSVYMGAYLINDVRMRNGVPNQEGLAQLKRTVEAHCGRWHSQREEGGSKALEVIHWSWWNSGP